jgi:hypothetical protein
MMTETSVSVLLATMRIEHKCDFITRLNLTLQSPMNVTIFDVKNGVFYTVIMRFVLMPE